jgi:methylthioribose-1-phosphate isomerase
MSDLDRHDTVRAVHWRGDRLSLLDQRRLPFEEVFVDCTSAAEVAQAIKDLVVRGAPAIGIAAAWGVVLAAQQQPETFDEAVRVLRASRPTAVNLMWALDRMQGAGSDVAALVAEAQAIQDEDLAANRHMGELGAALLDGGGVLTHCNTGWLQGARLTMYELVRDGIPARLIADSAAAHLMRSGAVQWVIVGADRIAANGDTANKIGTYQLAIAARHHGVKFMVVAPSSTVDMATPDGSAIEIELRAADELLGIGGKRTVVEGAEAWNPVFDVTPASLIDAIVTERGVIERPDRHAMEKLFVPGHG